MMTNLFSIFDPSASIINMNLNWLMIIIPLLMLPSALFSLPNPFSFIFSLIKNYLLSEMSPITKPNSKNISILFISIFFLILMSNVFGLLPFIFTPSSHMLFSLSLSLPLWLSFVMYGMIKNTNNTLAHLVPQGTPAALMFFMVLIESISMIIRPITLSVRLMANMTAGHMILCLISSQIPKLTLISFSLFPTQLILMILEMSVAFIQAYVFTILLTLYMMETK